jgi:hypothetical protein
MVMGRGRGGGGRHDGGIGAGSRTVQRTPGKRALTDGLVQRRPERPPVDGASTDDIQAAAAEGIAAPTAALPHRGILEQSFGVTLDGVEAHVGGAAAGSAAAIGAEAYATGSHVVLPEQPSLHTVAHEVAHVLQQREGIQLLGGVGVDGDRYEREADAVADAVVRGDRVDRFAGTAAASPGPGPVQRQAAVGPALDEDATALDPELEARITTALGGVLRGRDSAMIRRNVDALRWMFHEVPSDRRTAFRDRLRHPATGDVLAERFRARLSARDQLQLIAIVAAGGGGDGPQASLATDAVSDEAFVAQIDDRVVHTTPDPIVLNSKLMPVAHVTATAQAGFGPPAIGGPYDVEWTLADPTGLEVGGVSAPWESAQPVSRSFSFPLDLEGDYLLTADIGRPGETRVRVTRTLTVARPPSEMAAASMLSNEQLRAGLDDRRAQLAVLPDGAAGDGERARLGAERAVLEFAAAQRGVALQSPVDPGPNAYDLRGSVLLPDDPVAARAMIEAIFAQGGQQAVMDLFNELERKVQSAMDEAVQRSPDEDPMAVRERAHAESEPRLLLLWQQWDLLLAENRAFTDQFETVAREVARTMLADSRARAAAEIERYGVERVKAPRKINRFLGGDTDDGKAMATAAGQLIGSQTELERMRGRKSMADLTLFQIRMEEMNARLSPPGMDHDLGVDLLSRIGGGTAVETDGPEAAARKEELEQLSAALGRLILEAEQTHAQLYEEHAASFPVLAAYKRANGERLDLDKGGLQQLVSGDRGQELGDRLFTVIENIEKTQAELGSMSIWKEPRLVDLTSPQMLVAPGSVRERAVIDRIAEDNRPGWKDYAIMAVTFGLAILAAIPTGGSSLAAGVVVVAEIAGVATDLYLVAEKIDEYNIAKARTGTDVDKARALSATEPSLFWLAVDIVATGVGMGAASLTFKEVAHARRLARAAAPGAAEVEAALATIDGAHHQGRLSAAAAIRLEADLPMAKATRMAFSGDDGADAAGDAARAADAARGGDSADAGAARRAEPPTATGPFARTDARPRVHPDDLPSLQSKLGAPAVVDDALGAEVRVEWTALEGTTGVRIDRVVVGPRALVDDILARRRIIRAATRHNGFLAALRHWWDETIVGLGGRVENPHAVDTREWWAFEELRTLDLRYAQRRAAWRSGDLDEQVLLDDNLLLEGEYARHASSLPRAGAPAPAPPRTPAADAASAPSRGGFLESFGRLADNEAIKAVPFAKGKLVDGNLDEIAAHLDVQRVVVSLEPDAAIDVLPRVHDGRVRVEIIGGREATVDGVLGQADHVRRIQHYDRVHDRIRQAWDRVVAAAQSSTAPGLDDAARKVLVDDAMKWRAANMAELDRHASELVSTMRGTGNYPDARRELLDGANRMAEAELARMSAMADEVAATGDVAGARRVASQALPDVEATIVEKLVPYDALKVRFDAASFLPVNASAPIGRKLTSLAEADAALDRLITGDVSVLRDLGIQNVPDDLDPLLREWGIGQVKDGWVLYVGKADGVTPDAGVRSIRHTHPARLTEVDAAGNVTGHVEVGLRRGADDAVTVSFDQLVRAPGHNNAHKSGLYPSFEDLVSAATYGDHELVTRMAHVGDGKIANPVPGDLHPRVRVRIKGAHVAYSDPARNVAWYGAEVEFVADGEVLWNGPFYAKRNLDTDSRDILLNRPNGIPE